MPRPFCRPNRLANYFWFNDLFLLCSCPGAIKKGRVFFAPSKCFNEGDWWDAAEDGVPCHSARSKNKTPFLWMQMFNISQGLADTNIQSRGQIGTWDVSSNSNLTLCHPGVLASESRSSENSNLLGTPFHQSPWQLDHSHMDGKNWTWIVTWVMSMWWALECFRFFVFFCFQFPDPTNVFQLFSCGLRLRSWTIRGLRKMCGFSWVFCLTHPWHIDTSNGIKWHQMTHRSLRNDASQLRIYSSCWFKRPHETNAGGVSDHEILERSIREWILGHTFWVCTDGLFWRVQKFRTLIPVHSHGRLWHSTDKVKWWNHQHQSFWLTRSWQALVGITLICAWTLPKLTELLRFER